MSWPSGMGKMKVGSKKSQGPQIVPKPSENKGGVGSTSGTQDQSSGLEDQAFSKTDKTKKSNSVPSPVSENGPGSTDGSQSQSSGLEDGAPSKSSKTPQRSPIVPASESKGGVGVTSGTQSQSSGMEDASFAQSTPREPRAQVAPYSENKGGVGSTSGSQSQSSGLEDAAFSQSSKQPRQAPQAVTAVSENNFGATSGSQTQSAGLEDSSFNTTSTSKSKQRPQAVAPYSENAPGVQGGSQTQSSGLEDAAFGKASTTQQSSPVSPHSENKFGMTGGTQSQSSDMEDGSFGKSKSSSSVAPVSENSPGLPSGTQSQSSGLEDAPSAKSSGTQRGPQVVAPVSENSPGARAGTQSQSSGLEDAASGNSTGKSHGGSVVPPVSEVASGATSGSQSQSSGLEDGPSAQAAKPSRPSNQTSAVSELSPEALSGTQTMPVGNGADAKTPSPKSLPSSAEVAPFIAGGKPPPSSNKTEAPFSKTDKKPKQQEAPHSEIAPGLTAGSQSQSSGLEDAAKSASTIKPAQTSNKVLPVSELSPEALSGTNTMPVGNEADAKMPSPKSLPPASEVAPFIAGGKPTPSSKKTDAPFSKTGRKSAQKVAPQSETQFGATGGSQTQSSGLEDAPFSSMAKPKSKSSSQAVSAVSEISAGAIPGTQTQSSGLEDAQPAADHKDWMPLPLWAPKDPDNTPISKYRQRVNKRFGYNFQTSQDLHWWTIAHKHEFWIDLWDYVGMVPALPKGIYHAFNDSQGIADVPEFFPSVKLNYTENVLTGRDGDATALIGVREGGLIEGYERWNWDELRENVRRARSAMLRLKIKKGDVVAALMSNCPWIIALFLAAASIGAVFTSISPDMGLEGCVSRLQQVKPMLLFADSHQTYKGKRRSLTQKIKDLKAALKMNFYMFVVPLTREATGFSSLNDFLSFSNSEDKLMYERGSFSTPLVIVYSSGTTGPPKCIVHHHGTILNYKKIALLHNSLTPKDVVFQFSSTSWILWNIMNGHLSTGAALICYDGSPLYPDPSTLLKIIQHHRATFFGTSPRYLLELEMAGKGKAAILPRNYDLSSLRIVTTTGSTLTTDQFRWFYSRNGFPSDIHLSSVAGGTEIASSWIASNPAGPVYAGEMQMFALGHDVDVADPDTGLSIKHTGAPGELVCRSPFPSMPVYFHGDDHSATGKSPGKKYREAYFERFADVGVNCWAQHDWIVYNPRTGGSQIHGRSDGTLNPSGIRFGSAEIYGVSENPHFTGHRHISDTLCVGRKRPHDKDEVVFLFIKMQAGHKLDQALKDELAQAIKTLLSPRHVPRFMVEVREIPVTINGKKVEIAVKKILSGVDVKVSSTVTNPECLEEYRPYRDLEDERRRESKL